MKKTLVVLMSLIGVASAATISNIDKTDENLVWYWDFASVTSSVGDITYANDPTLQDGYATISAGSGMYTANNALKNAGLETEKFTVSFDIRSFGSGDVFSFGAGSSNDDWKKIMLSSNPDDDETTLSLKFYGNSQSVDTGIAYGTRDEWTTITLVGVTQEVLLYVDGELKGSLDMTPATNWCDGAADGFQFAGSFRNTGTRVDLNGSVEIDNLLVYNKSLTAAEVKALVVPEPATATLSLLALAGLAMRRRRK